MGMSRSNYDIHYDNEGLRWKVNIGILVSKVATTNSIETDSCRLLFTGLVTKRHLFHLFLVLLKGTMNRFYDFMIRFQWP